MSSHLPVIADVDTSYVASVPELAPLWTWAELTYVHSHPFLQAHPDGGDVGSVSISLLWRCENPVWIRQPYEFSVMGCNWACPGFLIKLCVWVSRCLYNLHCTSRQGFLVQARCFTNCSCTVSSPYAQQTLPAKDTYTYISAAPTSG